MSILRSAASQIRSLILALGPLLSLLFKPYFLLWVVLELKGALAQSSRETWQESAMPRGTTFHVSSSPQREFAGGRTAGKRRTHAGKEGLRLLSGTGYLSLSLAAPPFQGGFPEKAPKFSGTISPPKFQKGKKTSPKVRGSHRAF